MATQPHANARSTLCRRSHLQMNDGEEDVADDRDQVDHGRAMMARSPVNPSRRNQPTRPENDS